MQQLFLDVGDDGHMRCGIVLRRGKRECCDRGFASRDVSRSIQLRWYVYCAWAGASCTPSVFPTDFAISQGVLPCHVQPLWSPT
jgi:hypothetical protein